MCGRFYVESDYMACERGAPAAAALARLFSEGAVKTGEVFPGDVAAVVARSRAGEPSAYAMRWGFGGLGRPVINARGETAESRPMFRESAEKRRCAVPVSRWFEWRGAGGGAKRKYSFSSACGGPAYLAGLYRLSESGPQFVVLTLGAGRDIAFIHDRMPFVLAERDVGRWLDPSGSFGSLLSLARADTEYKAV